MKDISFSEPEGDQQTVYMCRLQFTKKSQAGNFGGSGVEPLNITFTVANVYASLRTLQ